VELDHAKPIQLAFDGIRQGRRGGRNPCGKSGGVSEAGKVDRDDVVVLAQLVVDRSPADHGLSHPVEQDQRLAHSGAMTSKVVGGEGRQLGRDDVSS
jgi:hypothetical protein